MAAQAFSAKITIQRKIPLSYWKVFYGENVSSVIDKIVTEVVLLPVGKLIEISLSPRKYEE